MTLPEQCEKLADDWEQAYYGGEGDIGCRGNEMADLLRALAGMMREGDVALPESEWKLHMPAGYYDAAWTSSSTGYDEDQMYAHAQAVALPLLARLAEAEKAIDLLSVMFDAWEEGPPYYEGWDGEGGTHIGNAVQLSDEHFHAICDLLNKHRPRDAARREGES